MSSIPPHSSHDQQRKRSRVKLLCNGDRMKQPDFTDCMQACRMNTRQNLSEESSSSRRPWATLMAATMLDTINKGLRSPEHLDFAKTLQATQRLQ